MPNRTDSWMRVYETNRTKPNSTGVEVLVSALRSNQLSADEFGTILRHLSQEDRTALFQKLDQLASESDEPQAARKR